MPLMWLVAAQGSDSPVPLSGKCSYIKHQAQTPSDYAVSTFSMCSGFAIKGQLFLIICSKGCAAPPDPIPLCCYVSAPEHHIRECDVVLKAAPLTL